MIQRTFHRNTFAFGGEQPEHVTFGSVFDTDLWVYFSTIFVLYVIFIRLFLKFKKNYLFIKYYSRQPYVTPNSPLFTSRGVCKCVLNALQSVKLRFVSKTDCTAQHILTHFSCCLPGCSKFSIIFRRRRRVAVLWSEMCLNMFPATAFRERDIFESNYSKKKVEAVFESWQKALHSRRRNSRATLRWHYMQFWKKWS